MGGRGVVNHFGLEGEVDIEIGAHPNPAPTATPTPTPSPTPNPYSGHAFHPVRGGGVLGLSEAGRKERFGEKYLKVCKWSV